MISVHFDVARAPNPCVTVLSPTSHTVQDSDRKLCPVQPSILTHSVLDK